MYAGTYHRHSNKKDVMEKGGGKNGGKNRIWERESKKQKEKVKHYWLFTSLKPKYHSWGWCMMVLAKIETLVNEWKLSRCHSVSLSLNSVPPIMIPLSISYYSFLEKKWEERAGKLDEHTWWPALSASTRGSHWRLVHAWEFCILLCL